MINRILYFVLVLLLTSCSTSRNVLNFSGQVVPNNLTAKQVYECIQIAGKEQKWQMEKIKPGLMRGLFYARNKTAEISIIFSKKDYSINYISSKNLRYKNGMINAIYNSWIQLLNDSIQKYMRFMS